MKEDDLTIEVDDTATPYAKCPDNPGELYFRKTPTCPAIDPDEALRLLEQFRKNLASGEIRSGPPDWIVRMCQGYIADLAGYPNRATWVEKIKN